MILASACLAGVNCRYDGKNCTCPEIQKLVSQGEAIPVCPEQLGGLGTPRQPAEIHGGTAADVLDGKARVIWKDGTDVTDNFIRGADEMLRIARLAGVREAVMKSRSPSCGCGEIYDGTFTGRIREGNGVAAELLIRNGIKVLTEKDIKKTSQN